MAGNRRGNSNYNGLQISLRHAMAAGLQFDFNYVYSKSIDVGSNAERVNGFESQRAGLQQPGDQRVLARSVARALRLRHHSSVECELGMGSALWSQAAIGEVAPAVG